MVPHVALPPTTLLTSQVTPVLVVLATLAVNVCELEPAVILLELGHTASITGWVVAEHVFDVALDGAVVVTATGLNTMLAVSECPLSSVTATCTVANPQEGAVTLAVAEVPF
jgi:hypothetical protein